MANNEFIDTKSAIKSITELLDTVDTLTICSTLEQRINRCATITLNFTDSDVPVVYPNVKYPMVATYNVSKVGKNFKIRINKVQE